MATVETKTVTKEIVTTVEEDEYVLHLSKNEARALYTVVGRVIGDSNTGPRKHTDNIFYALQKHSLTTYKTNPGYPATISFPHPAIQE